MSAHLAFDFGTGSEGGNRVDDDDIEGAGTHQHVDDLERLLAGVGLRDQEFVDIDTDGLGVDRIHRVLRIDVGADATIALSLGDHMGGESALTGRFRSEDLGDTASGKAAYAEGEIKGQGSGGAPTRCPASSFRPSS